ncbi:TonB-dependent receptor plug domain-containing protein [Mucilaginibacter myungsuensis]
MRKHLPVEKVYLHTNKPNYSLGDTLWFKGYVTDANGRPSKLSGLLYVELNDDSTEAVRRISLPIKEGAVRGQIPLTRVIFHEGAYTLRAYTNWQQNLGDSYFFSRRFYLAVPAASAWLVKSVANINKIDGREQLNVELKLSDSDRKPLALKDVEVKLYEGRFYLLKEVMRTGVDGSIKLRKKLRDSVDISYLRVQVTSLDKKDKNKRIQIPLNVARERKIDLQFLPEGGNLVAGLISKVGFKAIGEDGHGVNISGDILDSRGQKVATFASGYKGMGNFMFAPVAGERYTATINKQNISTKTFNLPAVQQVGTVMQVDAVSDTANISINLQGIKNFTADGTCYLIGSSAGKVQYAQAIDGNESSFVLPKTLLATGVVRFTLLKGSRPLNDRVVFIDHWDRAFINVKPHKSIYGRRDSVALEISVKDRIGMPLKGNFSVSVTDDSQVKADVGGNFNIAASLLLKAGLKGTIEEPGYYFKRKDQASLQALDNLMLTQGWVGYDWKDVFGAPSTPKFVLEKDLKITGKVVDAWNKPMPNAPVMISSQKPTFVTTTMADADGKFTFSGLPAIDSGSFFLQANNKNGKHIKFGGLIVNKFRAPDVPDTQNDVVTPRYVNSNDEQLNYVARIAQRANADNTDDVITAGTLLRNVTVNNVKPIKGSWYNMGSIKPTAAFDERDIQESTVTDLYQFAKQKQPGFKVIRGRDGLAKSVIDGRTPTRFGFVVDGPNFLPMIITDPTSVDELIDELKNFKMATFSGAEIYPWIEELKSPGIALISKSDAGWFRNNTTGTAKYRPLPLMYPQQFYSPRYKAGEPIVGLPDYRSTIYWAPDVYTDFNGIATVSFCTSDLPANYTINIQGNTPDGELGSAVLKLQEAVKTVVK